MSPYDLFRDSWADAVQVGALPLSIIGLLMAWIEVRKPTLANRISGILIEVGRIRFPGLPVHGTGELALRLFTFFHIIFFIVFWVWFVLVGASALPTTPVTRIPWILFALVFPVSMAFLFVRVVAVLLRLFGSYSAGRPLGALGLLFAVVGIVAELYQVATIINDHVG